MQRASSSELQRTADLRARGDVCRIIVFPGDRGVPKRPRGRDVLPGRGWGNLDLAAGLVLATLVLTPRLWVGGAFQVSLILGLIATLLGGLVSLCALNMLSGGMRRLAYVALAGLALGAWHWPMLIGSAIVLGAVASVRVDA